MVVEQTSTKFKLKKFFVIVLNSRRIQQQARGDDSQEDALAALDLMKSKCNGQPAPQQQQHPQHPRRKHRRR